MVTALNSGFPRVIAIDTDMLFRSLSKNVPSLSRGYNHLATSDSNNVLTVTMNRPKLHNAFNEEVIQELTHVFETVRFPAHEIC